MQILQTHYDLVGEQIRAPVAGVYDQLAAVDERAIKQKAGQENPSQPAFLFANSATNSAPMADLNLRLTTSSLYENLSLLNELTDININGGIKYGRPDQNIFQIEGAGECE